MIQIELSEFTGNVVELKKRLNAAYADISAFVRENFPPNDGWEEKIDEGFTEIDLALDKMMMQNINEELAGCDYKRI